MSGASQKPLDKRRARIARVNAKRPAGVTVDPVYRPKQAAKERLVDLLVELLDEASHSRGG